LLAKGLKRHSISDNDLEKTIEPIDADHIVLVIDACNSGQALESEEKRRGPMNSKSLAQLAYEKGIYILTAALPAGIGWRGWDVRAAWRATRLDLALRGGRVYVVSQSENENGNPCQIVEGVWREQEKALPAELNIPRRPRLLGGNVSPG